MNRNCMNQNMVSNNCRMMRQNQYAGDENERFGDIPVGNRKQLLCYIDEVSFAVYETLLFLDTHPDDQNALRFFHEHNRKRNQALKKYAELYGPLTISTADDAASTSWEWMTQPWPWEGGNW